MIRKTLAAATALTIAVFATAHAAPVNLVSNGDFSTGPSFNTEFSTSFGSSANVVSGWTGNDGYNLYFTDASAATTQNAVGRYSYTGREKLWTVTTSPTGGAFVALDGEQRAGIQGGISQTVSGLVAGRTYQLAFDWGAAQVQSRTGATTEQLQASLGGETKTTEVVSNASEGFSGWIHEVFTFTATGTSELLSFLSIGTPNGLPPIATLDGVSLTQSPVPVPEPASLALMGVGLIGLAVRRRRRAK